MSQFEKDRKDPESKTIKYWYFQALEEYKEVSPSSRPTQDWMRDKMQEFGIEMSGLEMYFITDLLSRNINLDGIELVYDESSCMLKIDGYKPLADLLFLNRSLGCEDSYILLATHL